MMGTSLSVLHWPTSNRIEECAVDELAADRRADRACPQPATARPQFHFRKHVAVDERATPESDNRRGDDAWRIAEDGFDRGILVARRQVYDNGCHQRREQESAETTPHHPPVARVAVDLGENVAK
jgi:hypothetical protein